MSRNTASSCLRAMEGTVLVIAALIASSAAARMNECALPDGEAQRCLPPFENAAFGRTVIASNTCGTPPATYCLQTGVTGVSKSCHECNADIEQLSHSADFLTDLNSADHETWWQSQTMLHDVQFPHSVNLTLNLHKTFDITYVRLKFHTSRPESFAIYKKQCEDCDWQPFQYYSGSCFSMYGVDNGAIVTTEDEQKPLCTDKFSDISPLTGGNVAFSTLEARPSAYNFDKSPVLQDWVAAVAIRISFNRINTFGDEVFKDPKVLRSYYYSVSDLSVGARCACNGHAAECYVTHTDALVCNCQHNTAGPDCEICADMFNDQPWSRATRENPAVCQECDCNGMASKCYFDPELYRQTGRGGHCVDCRENTDGPRCELCKPFHYRDASDKCMDCECSGIGALEQQCNENGQCRCKPGVGGARCDQCLPGYYGISEAGCSLCQCSLEGSVEGSICDPESGECVCKANVEGMNCDQCKLGTMNLQGSNPYGCTTCFCYGHSSVCHVSQDYTVSYIVSEFNTGTDGWTGRNYYDAPAQVTYNGGDISMAPDGYYMSYFVAPSEFLGQQHLSHNQFLQFELWVGDSPDARLDVGSGDEPSPLAAVHPSSEDLILEGEGFRVALSITDQGNPLPGTERQLYRFRLHSYAGFRPALSPANFQKMLNTLKKINIRSTYGEGLIGFLDNVQLTTAERGGDGPPADWVESCDVLGYNGTFANQCAHGYTRDPPNGGEYAICVRCNCNGHSDTCDPETGVCDCQHNTMDDHCELCQDGFYSNGDPARKGTPQECQPCPCPENSACAVMGDGDVVCTSCPPGHAGKQCELCMDGWFGDPRGLGQCQRCLCNGNIDENAIMNCNGTTGECLKCIHNTTGFYCDECLPGYFGKPVTDNPDERCMLCNCDHIGSIHTTTCNEVTGQCSCLPNVEGRACDQCRSGYWNIHSGSGCEACNCNQVGSSTGECDVETGVCDCLPGVGGQRCDQCLPNYYGLSGTGCKACECSFEGSEHLQCGDNGRCVCKEGVLGVKCDQCQENYYDIASGCIECPACYGLVQDAVNDHRVALNTLEVMTEQIGSQTGTNLQGNDDFEKGLKALNETLKQLQEIAKREEEQSELLADQAEEVGDQLADLNVKLAGVDLQLQSCEARMQEASDINGGSEAEKREIEAALDAAKMKLKQAMDDLAASKIIAEDSLSKEDNMSRVAQEAEALANKHQLAADQITDTAQNALDASKAAQSSVQDAIDVLETLLTTLDNMIESENKIPAAEKLRSDLMEQSVVVKNKAEAAKNESTDIFTNAGKLTVPVVDTEQMDREAQIIQDEAEKLMPQIEALDTEFDNNFVELEADMQKADSLLTLSQAAQDNTDQLLAQTHGAHLESLDAVELGNKTYQKVIATKKSLESFDEEINMNRENAENAIAGASDVRNTIDTANNKTAMAREALGTARQTATVASDKAQQALNIAENIQSSAQQIKTDAESSNQRAATVGSEVDKINSDLDGVETNLSAAEAEAESNKQAIANVTLGAKQANAKAEEAKKRVTSVLGQLNDLLERLNSMADVDDSDITAMEATYARLKAQVDASNIQQTVTALQSDVATNAETLRRYDEEIAKLTEAVDNLQEIYDAIPSNCSTNKPVEQP